MPYTSSPVETSRVPSLTDPGGSLDMTKTEDLGLLASNRGHKLQRGAELLSRKRRLWVAETENEPIETKATRLRGLDDPTDELIAEEDEPYIGLRYSSESISNRQSLKEVLRDPSVRAAFRSPYVERLAHSAMSMIEREKRRNQQLDRLSGILQRDDPWYRDVDLADDALVAEVWERLQDHICYSNAYLQKLQATRDLLMRATRDRIQLWARMKEIRAEQEKDRPTSAVTAGATTTSSSSQQQRSTLTGKKRSDRGKTITGTTASSVASTASATEGETVGATGKKKKKVPASRHSHGSDGNGAAVLRRDGALQSSGE